VGVWGRREKIGESGKRASDPRSADASSKREEGSGPGSIIKNAVVSESRKY